MSLLLGGALGATAAGGLLLAASGTPRARRITLDDRLAPYLRDAPRPSRLLAQSQALTPFPVLERLLRPVLGDAIAFLERWVGGALALAALQVATGSRPQPVAVLVSAGVLTALGVLGRDRWRPVSPGRHPVGASRRGW